MNLKKKLGSIIDGWRNALIEDKQMMPLYQQRFDACNNCLYNIMKTCSICLCPIVSKTKSLSEECPDPDGSRWKPYPRFDEQGLYRLREELPTNLQELFDNGVILEEEWQAFVEKNK